MGQHLRRETEIGRHAGDGGIADVAAVLNLSKKNSWVVLAYSGWGDSPSTQGNTQYPEEEQWLGRSSAGIDAPLFIPRSFDAATCAR